MIEIFYKNRYNGNINLLLEKGKLGGRKRMRKQMKKIGCLLAVIFCVLSLGGCKKEVIDRKPISGAISFVEYKEDPLAKIIPRNQNLLTGVGDLSEEAIGKRPVAVMVNNVEPALPQYGITQADVIFEIPVEGNLTRLMALYADYTTVPKICPVRSCRYYFPALAKGFDAYYVHWGSDQSILGYVDSLGIERYDGMANPHNLFGRDSARRSQGYSLEHTGYFDGTKFAAAVEADGKRTDLKEDKMGTAFQFCDMDEVITPTGSACDSVYIDFGPTTSAFSYNEETNTYTKDMNGHAHVDAVTGKTLEFTNVFVLETSIYIRDEKGHKSVNWAGSGSAVGYYVSNGAVEKIYWSKENGTESGYLRFYKEDGELLTMNRGKSYIAYCTSGQASF